MESSEKQARAELAEEAEGRIQMLADAPFLRASFSYGDELRLHFGRPAHYESPRLAGRTRGEWVLGLRATPWALVADGSILSRSHDEQQHALHQFAQLEGKRLTDTMFRRSDAAVTLRFDEGYWFMALTEPRTRSRSKGPLDLWELLIPDGRFVVARADGSLFIDASTRDPGP